MSEPPRADTTSESVGRPHGALRLIVSSASGVSTLPLPPSNRFVIGRAPESDVVIDDESVSRRHARMTIGSEILVEDLESKHGTRVLGVTVRPGEVRRVAFGIPIDIGGATLFVDGRPKRHGADEAAQLEFVTENGSMRELLHTLEIIAPSSLSVVIQGETGTGKELVAEALHARSERAQKPFVKLNCAAFTAALLESELFGHERGAFTGAVRSKQGLLESATGGTVFLDEVSELPLELQAKLLRVVESGELIPVGSLETKKIDVRYLSATNLDLKLAVEAGKFRRDLFYRLNAFTIGIPPLRERTDDILPLARYFIQKAGASLAIGDSAERALLQHAWDGNVRELRNVIERAVVLARGQNEIRAEHLGLGKPVAAHPAAQLKESVSDHERKVIEKALAATGGNQTEAAKLLGIGRRTLIDKLETYDIARPRKNR